VQEICTLRAMRRALETESRKLLTGHEGGNAGNSQGRSYGFTRQRSTLPTDMFMLTAPFIEPTLRPGEFNDR
jgi:hypothetical protein